MTTKAVVFVGTQKGIFRYTSNLDRAEWRLDGPFLKGWEALHIGLDRRGAQTRPRAMAALGHQVYGSTIQFSTDLGSSWEETAEAPTYGPEEKPINRIWNVVPGPAAEPDLCYAGVSDAGLFRSVDSGRSWQEVPGLRRHETQSEWCPGAGGLCCHSVIPHPEELGVIWVGISAVGVFRTEDAGETWQLRNDGLEIVVPSQNFPDLGSCVHSLHLASDNTNLLYQQNHRGVFRSQDGADRWERIENGLPTVFGFPMVVDTNDSQTLWIIPLESDEYRFFRDGQLTVFKTTNGGEDWQPMTTGLDNEPCYSGVLRHAFDSDGIAGDECGLYFGTSTGKVFSSRDAGASWRSLPGHLPRVLSVTAAVVEES